MSWKSRSGSVGEGLKPLRLQPKGDVVQVLIYAAGVAWLLLSIPVRAMVGALRRVELAGAAV